jgi:Holliday junction resolvase
VRDLRAHYGGFWSVIHGSAFQRAGLPDLIGCHEGRYVGLEVKQPGKQATPLQTHTLEQIIRAGGIAGVITSFEEAKALLEA